MKVDPKSDKSIIPIPTLAAICCSKDGKLVKSAALHCNEKIIITATPSTTNRLMSGC